MEGELEKKFERFERNLRTLSEAKRKYSAEGLFGWITSPRSTVEEAFDPFLRQADEGQGQNTQEHDNQMQEQHAHEENEDSLDADTYVDADDSFAVSEDHAEQPEDTGGDLTESDLISVSEASMSTSQPVEEVTLPNPTTKTEVVIHSILTGMMDTVKYLAVSNKKMQSEHQENEARRMDRKLRRRQSSLSERPPAVDDDVDTAMQECGQSSPKTPTPTPTPRFDTEIMRMQVTDSSVMRKQAKTDVLHDPVDGPNRSKRKRTLGPFTQVKGRRASDEAVGRHRRLQKRRPAAAAAAAAASSPDASPRAVVELFLNPWAASSGGGGVGGAPSSAESDERVKPTPGPRHRLSWRPEPTGGVVAKKTVELSSTKEQPSPREASPRVPLSRRPKPPPASTQAAEAPTPPVRQHFSWRTDAAPGPKSVAATTSLIDAPDPAPLDAATPTPPVRQRISWRTDAAPGPKSVAATTSLIDAPAPAPVDVDAATPTPRKSRLHRRKAAKPAAVEDKMEEVEEVVEVAAVEPEPAPAHDAASTPALAPRGRGNRTQARQQRWQRRQDELAARTLADEVAARVRAQRQWLRAQEELGGEEALLSRSYELPTVSSVMKRVVKSYMPVVGLTGIPFVVGTSTSPTHHCGLKLQAELRKFKLKLPNKLGQNNSAMSNCTEGECGGARCCPAAAHASQCPSIHTTHGPQRPEDRWADACAEPSCTCCVRKTQPAEKVLQQYVASRTQMSAAPSRNRLAGSRLDVSRNGAVPTASAAALPLAASLSSTKSVLSKTDLHGESLQTLKVKIGGLKECLVRLQDRFTRLHQMRNDATLDLTEKQIAELDKKIENKEQEINVVLALMREIFTLSRSQKASVASMAESTRSRQSHGIVGGGGGGFALRRK